MKITVNFGYKKQDYVSYIAHLSQNNSQELFFRFIFRKAQLPHYHFVAPNKIKNDISSIDHISIHKDGTTHIVYYDSLKNRGTIPYNRLKPLVEMPQIHYLPLFIFSFYDLEVSKQFIGRSTPMGFKGYLDIPFIWDAEDRNQFSIVVFLVGGAVNGENMLQTHFPGIFDAYNSPALINCFGNHVDVVRATELNYEESGSSLLLGYTKRVIPKSESEDVIDLKKSQHFDRIELATGFSLTQSDALINGLILTQPQR